MEGRGGHDRLVRIGLATASTDGAATTTPATGDGTSPVLPVAVAGASAAALALARRRPAE